MASLPTTYFLPVGFDLVTRRLAPSAQRATRVLRWTYSSVAAPFSFADPHDDPSLRALYEPYPRGAPDSDIFETEDSIHDRTPVRETRKQRMLRRQAAALTLPSHIIRSNAVLRRCVEEGDYAGAISLQRDLNALHTPITPRRIYSRVANYLLDNPNQSNPHAFLEWCKLVPNLSNPWSERTRMPHSMKAIFNRLLQKPEDVDTLCRFSLLAARKGMAKCIAIPAISHTACYSSPEVSSKLLLDLTEAAAASSPSSIVPSKFVKDWNGTFIRTLCLSGRVDAARENLFALHNTGREIAPFAYQVVIDELRAVGQVAYAMAVGKARNKAGLWRFRHEVESYYWRTRTTTSMPDGPLAQQLKWVRQKIDANHNLSINQFSSFIRAYLSTGRHRAIPLVRNRLIRLSTNRRWKQGLGFWGVAEMELCRLEGKHEKVLQVFQTIFMPIGITDRLMDVLGVPCLPSSQLPEDRLWPSSEAIALASWSAAHLASRREEPGVLERCYSIFLQACSLSPDRLFGLPPAMKLDATAFQPWVGAFARVLGPQGIIKIMGDMKDRGISPTIMTWNALAKAYVTSKDWETAKSLLTRMATSQAQGSRSLTASKRERLRNRLGPLPDWGFPAANLSTYYVLLRELCMTKQMSAAQELIDLLARTGYTSGDERLDSFINLVKKSAIHPIKT